MIQRHLLRLSALHSPIQLLTPIRNAAPKRTLIAAPKPNSGPLMTRRADRALPSITRTSSLLIRTLPVFLVVIGASSLGIFNYQKSSSSVVTSSLYALRVNGTARSILGDEIYFRRVIPWIWGSIDQLHGKIDVRFSVKGKKGWGIMRFKSIRRSRMGVFETTEWSLETEDGRVIDLMNDQTDPLTKLELSPSR
ncbi:DUF1783-domain-containing protein [Tothia fuscella]|uniref:DUF1783-domain-containing protein n=1 Tax=Tothia fuscella TaxID=1048955 RepID=A0A9P4TYZ1_9PEZI|nr:DUF1783-domain-containing protein [Tothia fuscella]